MITVSRLGQFDEIQETQWNDLLSKTEVNEVFLTYQWVHSWWICCAENRELFLIIAKKADQIVGIAPLMLSFKRLGVFRYRVLEFVGTGESDYCDFIVLPEHKRDALNAMFGFLDAQSHLWDAIVLVNIPEHSSTISYLRRVKAAYPSYNMKDELYILCPTLLIQKDTEFAQSCLKKKSLRRHFNYFDKNGTLEHKTAQSPAEIFAELENLFQQHIERWLIAGDRSKFHDARIKTFYRCLVDSLLPRGWLKFSIVRFNGEPIAYHFGFTYNEKFIWYKPTFNIDYFKNSPGEVLIKYLLEDSIQSGMSEFDFTLGDEPFKRRFANEVRRNFKIEIWGNKPLWILSRVANCGKQRFKRKLPKMYAFLRRYFKSSQRAEYIHEFQDRISKNGILRTGWTFIQKAGQYCFDVKVLLVYQKSVHLEKISVQRTDISIREGVFSDVKQFIQNRTPFQQRDLIVTCYDRFRTKDKLFIAERNSSAVYHGWVSFQKTIHLPQVRRSLNLDEQSAYIYDCDIHKNNIEPDHFPDMLCDLTSFLRESGIEKVYISCTPKDLAYKTGIERAGFEAFATYRYIRFFGISLRL